MAAPAWAPRECQNISQYLSYPRIECTSGPMATLPPPCRLLPPFARQRHVFFSCMWPAHHRPCCSPALPAIYPAAFLPRLPLTPKLSCPARHRPCCAAGPSAPPCSFDAMFMSGQKAAHVALNSLRR